MTSKITKYEPCTSDFERRQARIEGASAGARFARAERDAADAAATADGRSVLVRIDSSEGNRAVPAGSTFDSLDAFDGALIRARSFAPEGGAYSKVRFVVWIDGESYTGRYDVQDVDHSRMTIVKHMRAHLAYAIEHAACSVRDDCLPWVARLDRFEHPTAGGCNATASVSSQVDYLDWLGC